MSTRMIILGVAVLAAGGAGYLAMNMVNQPAPDPVEVQADAPPPISLDQVLVADQSMSVGDRVERNLRWQDWPTKSLAPDFITKSARPDALEELATRIVRSPVVEGEPIRPIKLLGADQSFMSSILPSGKRAVATQIAADTSAGGFILPNDYVDVIMTRRGQGNVETFVTETIMENIRVLAIDQTVREAEDGSLVIVGQTATLELSPRQAEIIVVAQQMSDRLTLALRSVQDVDSAQIDESASHLLSDDGTGGQRGSVNVIRGGNLAVEQGGD
ncbi:MAG: Flp pilus assembly protein CpaB [Pseudomonadota bacterium]